MQLLHQRVSRSFACLFDEPVHPIYFGNLDTIEFQAWRPSVTPQRPELQHPSYQCGKQSLRNQGQRIHEFQNINSIICRTAESSRSANQSKIRPISVTKVQRGPSHQSKCQRPHSEKKPQPKTRKTGTRPPRLSPPTAEPA
jgi:hypothetical protein